MTNQSLIHSDIFFFVSTIALVFISIGIVIALYYAIRILRNARDVSDSIKTESVEIVSGVKKLRGVLRDEGVKWITIGSMIRAFFTRSKSKHKTNKKN